MSLVVWCISDQIRRKVRFDCFGVESSGLPHCCIVAYHVWVVGVNLDNLTVLDFGPCECYMEIATRRWKTLVLARGGP